MKKILLPTDFSEDAQKAYEVAISLAKANNATIYIYHLTLSWAGAIEAFSVYDDFRNYETLQRVDIEESIRRMRKLTTSDQFKDVNVHGEVKLVNSENSAEEFVQDVNKEGFDLIVLGTSGHDKRMESFAEVVTRGSKSPVISCYKKVETFTPKNILVPTDFETVNAGFFFRLESVLPKDGVTKTLLFVNTKKNFFTDKEVSFQYHELVKRYNLTNTVLLVKNTDSVNETIIEESKKADYDMLALTTHGRKGFSRFFSKSHAEDIVNHSEKPVFTYNLHDFIESITEGSSFRSGFTG